ncbi:MAG: HAMP domain-containing protein, partial [Rhizobiales bacterium]|nr:HAMP domain-containing protein [Hyphomicrobiales bacterium]
MNNSSVKINNNTKLKRLKNISLFTLGLLSIVAMIFVASATYAIITGLTDIELNQEVLNSLVIINTGSIVFIVILIILQFLKLLKARRSNVAGANLHSRLVFYFSIISAIPAILVAIFASYTLSQGLDSYFSDRTKKVIDNSLVVAELYHQSHSDGVWKSAEAIAQEINRFYPIYRNSMDIPAYRKIVEDNLEFQVIWKQLDGALLWDLKNDRVLAKYDNFPEYTFPRPWDNYIEKAKKEGIAKFTTPGKSFILIYLEKFDQYLYVYRNVDAAVTQQLLNSHKSVREYYNLEKQRDEVQIVFALMYIGIGLTLVLSAIWVGFQVTNQLIRPIRRLINAAQMISNGEFKIVLPIHKNEGDLADLSHSFNDMTKRLTDQRQELITANESIDSRRRFNEAMLSGVSSGVIGLDINHKITLLNRPAEKILRKTSEDAVGFNIIDIAPDLGSMIEQQFEGGLKEHNGQITLSFNDNERILNYRITEEKSDNHNEGYVITIDDITDLITAQRTSAWSDIARRIAHEIKNPLTPIQLSAERIKRKYSKNIPSGDVIFDQCIDTIIRQVGDIGSMVDEFASFAQTPSAKLEKTDINKCIKEAIFLQKVANPDLDIKVNLPKEIVKLNIDRRLVTQVITNIVKNATESVETAFVNKLLQHGQDKGEIS